MSLDKASAGGAKVVVVLFVLMASVGFPAKATAQSIGDFVAGSSRSVNPEVISILLGGDTTDAVAAAKALGERNDAYVGDVLEALFSRITGPESYRAVLLLRLVIVYDFLRPSVRPSRIHVNVAALEDLLGSLQAVPSAETKGALLDVSCYLPAGAVEKPLLDEGAFLLGYLQSTGGRFDPRRLSEALAFLGACRAHDNEVLRSQVVALIERARDATFVREARNYLEQTK